MVSLKIFKIIKWKNVSFIINRKEWLRLQYWVPFWRTLIPFTSHLLLCLTSSLLPSPHPWPLLYPTVRECSQALPICLNSKAWVGLRRIRIKVECLDTLSCVTLEKLLYLSVFVFLFINLGTVTSAHKVDVKIK